MIKNERWKTGTGGFIISIKCLEMLEAKWMYLIFSDSLSNRINLLIRPKCVKWLRVNDTGTDDYLVPGASDKGRAAGNTLHRASDSALPWAVSDTVFICLRVAIVTGVIEEVRFWASLESVFVISLQRDIVSKMEK